jgi:ribosomal protein S18 acetylase RimI-like enzyme
MKYKLPKDYVIKEIPKEEFHKLWTKPAKIMFNDRSLFYNHQKVNTKKELQKFDQLNKQFSTETSYRIHLGLFYKNKFVGWSWGWQETPLVFYMCNSGILKEHRRKGLYTILLNELMKKVCEKGFMSIYSRHVITNNDILIPKLKFGFKLTSFELSERFGTMVHLTYFPQKTRRDILDFRSGLKRPDKKMKKIFKL